ncbi:MAG: oligosaccharide flippase family protein [Bacteroidota bacterium]|nr:oligosaccharide flippase family protein [Bacteroidota bacterium]
MAPESGTRRIAKNTLVLYVRMLFLMAVSLYTSRAVLDALGIDDYGIYNVVGGVVAMFTMISGSLSAAISRFITYELGKGSLDRLKVVFSSSVLIQLLLSVVFIVIAESLGLWFLNAKLNIPSDRMYAANWVYQLSIVTFAVNLISIPYNAAIVAHEEMTAFAYISIFEGVSKLIVAFIIVNATTDKLILYSVLIAVIAVVVRIVYGVYCKKKFDECTLHLKYEKTVFDQIFSFAGWNIIGAASAVCRDQGGNIIINLFYGPAVNAARGVAMQVCTAINGFVANFQMALNPQITKNYASGNMQYMLSLVFKGSRFSYYILWLISLPVIVKADYILSLWLVEVPEHAVHFLQLVIVFSLCESLSGPLKTSMYATGEVKYYQIVVGGLQLMNLPIAYFCLRYGLPPESVFVVSIILSLACLIARLQMLKPLINIPRLLFVKEVCLNTLLVTLGSLIPAVLVSMLLGDNLLSFIIVVLFCFIVSCMVVLYIGCRKEEREMVFVRVRKATINLLYRDSNK